MTCAVFAFTDSVGPAGRLAQLLGVPLHPIALHRFPDGESLVRVPAASSTSVLYRSLDGPNPKIFELLLAASALRDGGAKRVILVAPYLAYMRQDMAFNPGEAVSQKVIGELITAHFDGLITIDPHLHRITTLSEAVKNIPAIALTAASVLAEAIDNAGNPVLIGPDSESRQWVEAIAQAARLDVLVGEKQRHGDRDVQLTIPSIDIVAGRRVVLVDDVISSGATLVETARLAVAAGAFKIEAAVTHCLSTAQDLARLRDAGISRLIATDTIAGPHADVPVAALIARACRELGLP
jgi:ribose-phosphate pyrophosphokinase